MENVKLNLKLHENQLTIFNCPALNVVVKAGKRFGKSELAIYKVLFEAGRKPGVYWYIAPYFSHAEGIAWTRFRELIPDKYIRKVLQNKLYIELINGSIIILKGADNQVSLRGPKIDGAVFDEAAYMDQYIWNNIIRGQLLGVNGEPPGFAFFISSPLNPIQNMGKKVRDWYPDFFNDALRKRANGDMDWAGFKFTIYDNPLLSKEFIDQIRADSTEDEFNVEYLANESAYAGQVYSEFNFDKHVKEADLGRVELFVRGIDWGIDHPTVCLFAQIDVQNQKVHIQDEYVQSGYTIEESVDIIQKKTGSRPVDWTVCDPSLNKRNSQTKRTDKQEFDRLGVYCVPGDNNNRGYNITKMFLKKDMISIHPKCKNLIKGLKNLQWTDTTGDDAPDCLRYLCVRLHDLTWNGLFKKESAPETAPALEFNLNNPYLFPKRKESNNAREQIANF